MKNRPQPGVLPLEPKQVIEHLIAKKSPGVLGNLRRKPPAAELFRQGGRRSGQTAQVRSIRLHLRNRRQLFLLIVDLAPFVIGHGLNVKPVVALSKADQGAPSRRLLPRRTAQAKGAPQTTGNSTERTRPAPENCLTSSQEAFSACTKAKWTMEGEREGQRRPAAGERLRAEQRPTAGSLGIASASDVASQVRKEPGRIIALPR